MSLIIKNLTFTYDRKNKNAAPLIKDFSAEFLQDRITALTGRNGVGKTTLSRLIMGILTPVSGEMMLGDRVLNGMTLAERGRLIGYVMQNPARQIFSTTVEEEMRYGLENLGLPENEIESRMDIYLDIFGLADRKNDFPFRMSHGEKQRLVLAAVLAMKPEYLILDEPTAGLDTKRRQVLGQLISSLDCGVMVISHDDGFISRYCDEKVEMVNSNEQA